MMFITIDASGPCTTRSASRRPVHGRKKTTGGKGGKGGNLESAGKTGSAGDVAKWRKLAETGGNWRELVFAALWRRESIPERAAGIGQLVAEIAGNAEIPLAVPRPAITLRITVGSARSVMPSTMHRLVSATVSSRWNGTGHAQAVQHRLHLLELKIGRALQRNKEAGGNAPSCRIR